MLHSYNVQLMLFLLTAAAVNVPFGYLRRGYRKLSRPWARCLYVPILINIAMRRLMGFSYEVIPLVVTAVLIGQAAGGALRTTRMVAEHSGARRREAGEAGGADAAED
ncbi:MAG TPA: hypothetical protein ENJ37_09765 [Deltaproteobacteria bacterium]|nr:hypothetical protein [Deltaproteobacteria bacterium]